LVGFEYRAAAGLASSTSEKGRFADWARGRLGCSMFGAADTSALRVRTYLPVPAS
jgi:hypothetical protein